MEVKITYKDGKEESLNGIDFGESEVDKVFYNLVSEENDDGEQDTKYQISLSEIRKIEWI